ncbi:hypothetical protein SNE40_011858 [Patella caerulea]|uniref:Uncharacterized protein n=1 Tax=Patella caerulea TaxID=87958 RepID=A0AAN8JQW9_PATCE
MSSIKYETHQDDTISQSKLVTNPVTEKFQIVRDWFWRRSILEIWLMVLALIFIIIIIALAIVYDGKRPREQKDKQGACLTPGCVRVAARISDSVDTTIKPCEDFYNFACGGWMKKTIIPKGYSGYSILHEIYEDVDKILKESLEKPLVSTEAEAVKKAKRFYKSCMDESKIEALGNNPLLDFIKGIDKWPLITSNWSDTDYDLEKLLIRISKEYDYPIIRLRVTADEEEPQKNIIYLREPIYGLPFGHTGLNDPTVKMLQDMVVKVAVMLGANETTAKQDALDMVELAIKLENISVPEKLDPRPTGGGFNENETEIDVPSGPTTAPTAPEKKITLDVFSQKYPDAKFNWLTYVQGIMAAAGVPNSITKDEYVINNTPHYFERLFAILNSTPKRTITNYAIWRSIEVRLLYNPKKFRDIYNKYLDAIYGEYPIPLRYKYCAPRTTISMRKAVSRGFIQEAFSKDAKADVLQMIKTMQASFNGLLASNDWMDDVSRKGAKNKSDTLTMKIGYDERLLDDTYLNTLYQNYIYNDDTFLWNMITYIRELHSTALRKLRVQNVVSKDEWYYDPFIVNTYYSAPKNEIEFSAGIIQPPYYHQDFPAYVNFAGIGDAIGHELTHSGLDDRGEIKHSNGKSTKWWTDDVINNFKKNALCLTNQYNSYTLPGTKIKVLGERHLKENIADNGGLKLSFQAYRDWVQQRGAEEPMLPGLDLTPNQIFFINYAQSTCEKYTKAGHVANNKYGFHSPGRYRVIGTLQNSLEFSKTFGCAVGSYMNPVKKCKLW